MKCPNCGKEIANDSQFCEYCGEKINLIPVKEKEKNYKPLWIVLMVLLFLSIACGLVYYQYQNLQRELNETHRIIQQLEQQIAETGQLEGQCVNTNNNHSQRMADIVTTDSLKILSQQVNELKATIRDLKDELSMNQLEVDGLKRTIGKTYPILISSVQMGNFNSDGSKETDFGNRIYSSYTYYLEPRIKFLGFTSGTVFIKMRLYKPDGTLWQDGSSRLDCSRTSVINSKMNVEKTIQTSDFRVGGGYRGCWRSGTYRIEFWYNDRVCLYSGTFNIE